MSNIIAMSYQQQSRMIHPPNHRLVELLDAVKHEFENVNNEVSAFRMHKDDFDQNVSAFFYHYFSIYKHKY